MEYGFFHASLLYSIAYRNTRNNFFIVSNKQTNIADYFCIIKTHILNTAVIFRKPGMEGCDEEVSFEKLKTPQTHPKPQSPLWNCLDVGTVYATMPNIQSRKISFNKKGVNVQLRMILVFCVKAAILLLQLFISLHWEEEQPGPSHWPGSGPFPAWSEQVPWANGGNRRSLALMRSSFPSLSQNRSSWPRWPSGTDWRAGGSWVAFAVLALRFLSPKRFGVLGKTRPKFMRMLNRCYVIPTKQQFPWWHVQIMWWVR